MRIIINVDVPALEPAIAFYTAALGLTHARTLDEDVAELTGADATIYLLQKPAGTKAVESPPIARDFGRHWTPVHFDLVVEDVDAAARRAIAAGRRVPATPTHHGAVRPTGWQRNPARHGAEYCRGSVNSRAKANHVG